ncbi:hypothetical protein GR183_03065 [Stappia sp. GBMRC 2046]|uniref:Uncharacterized protein n=1 Tax=Stappia sediminis TaxID=2692190 RepID=A0A7X3LRR4_9HYPH|nr:hypothetical protein [Stappia sediminis]MXN63873.1 hypothetical protein [Stappia sediminis]
MTEKTAGDQRFPRHDPEIGRPEAEEILFRQLEEAARLFNEGQPKSRQAIYQSLEVVKSFLGSRSLSGQVIEPLSALKDDLLSIDTGTPSLFFGPKAPRSKVDLEAVRSRHRRKSILRLYTAACAEVLQRDGTSVGESPRIPYC